MLEKVLPNAKLKAKPNLESRIKTLKRDWSIVYGMLSGKNNSGFGWDKHRQLVVAEDAVWNSYINSHKEVAQFKHCSFPYYDQLTTIYAKDRAIGKDAQTAANIIKEIDAEDIATTNTHEERNYFHGCKADVSLDDMDLSGTQQQPAINQGGLTEDERFRALSKIPDHQTQMIIFFSLPSSMRLEWVRRFLADH
ncbi:hypothetical protein CXB51_008316 [Gossypium anomalum]|uniref:Myb/SANT-like domain-containing protein n=1 Tax=Gossypium anomalum TaxID=47600 RepID=A0A8J5Z902_9ROSI|nr:hypothetical protein CXB51_008316 [Gossypium anomalum]